MCAGGTSPRLRLWDSVFRSILRDIQPAQWYNHSIKPSIGGRYAHTKRTFRDQSDPPRVSADQRKMAPPACAPHAFDRALCGRAGDRALFCPAVYGHRFLLAEHLFYKIFSDPYQLESGLIPVLPPGPAQPAHPAPGEGLRRFPVACRHRPDPIFGTQRLFLSGACRRNAHRTDHGVQRPAPHHGDRPVQYRGQGALRSAAPVGPGCGQGLFRPGTAGRSGPVGGRAVCYLYPVRRSDPRGTGEKQRQYPPGAGTAASAGTGHHRSPLRDLEPARDWNRRSPSWTPIPLGHTLWPFWTWTNSSPSTTPTATCGETNTSRSWARC